MKHLLLALAGALAFSGCAVSVSTDDPCIIVKLPAGAQFDRFSPEYGTWWNGSTGKVIGYSEQEDSVVFSHVECFL